MERPFLVGPRIYLRALELTDVEHAIRCVTHPEVRAFLHRAFPLNAILEETYIREVASKPDPTNFVIALREGDRPIGLCGFHGIGQVARCAELGITIGEPDCWGQGYGAEAIGLLLEWGFLELNLHRVELQVSAKNPRAIACYEKLGFVREGVRRQAHFVRGEHTDMILMGWLRPEWAEARG